MTPSRVTKTPLIKKGLRHRNGRHDALVLEGYKNTPDKEGIETLYLGPRGSQGPPPVTKTPLIKKGLRLGQPSRENCSRRRDVTKTPLIKKGLRRARISWPALWLWRHVTKTPLIKKGLRHDGEPPEDRLFSKGYKNTPDKEGIETPNNRSQG